MADNREVTMKMYKLAPIKYNTLINWIKFDYNVLYKYLQLCGLIKCIVFEINKRI